MIVKIEDSNIREVINYLESNLFELYVTAERGGLSEKVFIDLYSNTFTLDYTVGYIELLGFSRIDGNPMFNLHDVSKDIFSTRRTMKIKSLLENPDITINRFIQLLRNPTVIEIKPIEDWLPTFSLFKK